MINGYFYKQSGAAFTNNSLLDGLAHIVSFHIDEKEKILFSNKILDHEFK